jgi:hypothetical protein
MEEEKLSHGKVKVGIPDPNRMPISKQVQQQRKKDFDAGLPDPLTIPPARLPRSVIASMKPPSALIELALESPLAYELLERHLPRWSENYKKFLGNPRTVWESKRVK